MNPQKRLLTAIQMATLAHVGQQRKGSGDPYVVHPIRVAASLTDVSLPAGVSRETCLLAAVLHDVLEDTALPREILRQEFGDEVVGVIEELTQDKSLPKPERRQQMLDHCGSMSAAARTVKLADRLDNMREMDGMGTEFIRRYCAEAKVMLAAMTGTCAELEHDLAEVITSHQEESGDDR